MRAGSRHLSLAIAVLPLTLAVLLVSMGVPVACSAQTMFGCDQASMPMPMHGQAPVQGDPVCRHSTANIPAVTPDHQARPAPAPALPAVAAPAVVAPVAAPVLPAVTLGEPPGLLLTISQLRI